MEHPDASSAVARWARWLAVAAVAVSVLATATYAVGLMGTRPWIYGEAEPLFEASRIRDGYPLYVDPLQGEHEYGPVPTRSFVGYPPVWAWALSHAPASSAPWVARAACSLAWFGLLAGVAWRSRASCRRAAWLAAGLVAGTFILALWATSGRPDSIATVLAGLALARTAARGRVDALVGALLGVVVWTKPNVLGIAVGLTVFALTSDRRSALRFVLGGLATAVPILGAVQVVSHGVWWSHVVGAIHQPLSAATWWLNVGRRSMFLAPAALTTWVAVRGRGEPGVRAALYAWAASLSWALLSLAKIGSASNYWMEPAVAAVVVFVHAPLPSRAVARPALFAVAVAASCGWIAAVTLGGVLEAFEREPRRAALLARARSACGARPGEVVVSDEPGTELALDGRVIAPCIQILFLIQDGRMPVARWVEDLERAGVTCAVEEDGAFHYLPEVAAAFDARFVEIDRVEDWRLYALRERR